MKNAWSALFHGAFLLLLAGCGGTAPIEPNVPAEVDLAKNPVAPSAETAIAAESYWDFRKKHPTVLINKGPSPQQFVEASPPDGVREVTYMSGQLKLKGWYALPLRKAEQPVPVLVYFHGGYAFGEDDFTVCEAFLTAGFAVFTPMLRAENGNPGFHEMCVGEVDDGRAALEWIKKQPEIDPNKIFTFGHSAGGIISCFLALDPTNPARLTGSVGGTYDESHFGYYIKNQITLPFDVNNLNERRLRSFPDWAGSVCKTHIAYVGTEDPLVLRGAETARRKMFATKPPMSILRVSGNHGQSLLNAMPLFLKEAQKNLAN